MGIRPVLLQDCVAIYLIEWGCAEEKGAFVKRNKNRQKRWKPLPWPRVSQSEVWSALDLVQGNKVGDPFPVPPSFVVAAMRSWLRPIKAPRQRCDDVMR